MTDHRALWDALQADDDEHHERLRRLLERGSDPNAREGERGYTPLHFAAILGVGAEVIEALPARVALLVAHGAAVNARADTMYGTGWTPLHLAVWEGVSGVVRSLLEAGADLEARTDDGATPFELAVCGRDTEILELLLTAGADWRQPISGEPAVRVARKRLLEWRDYVRQQGPALPPETADRVERTLVATLAHLERLEREHGRAKNP